MQNICKTAIATAIFLVLCFAAQAAGDDSFTDSRDGQDYRTVQIGKQIWMAENLNYKSANSWCYANKDSNCEIYGRLYTWETARKICPAGWHLPKRNEWFDLQKAIEDEKDCVEDGWEGLVPGAWGWESGGLSKNEVAEIRRKELAGKKLKSKSQWNGTDDYGFSALPGGMRYYNQAIFKSAGTFGYYWIDNRFNSQLVYFWTFHTGRDKMEENIDFSTYGLSVRCVHDNPVPDSLVKKSEWPNKHDKKPICKTNKHSQQRK